MAATLGDVLVRVGVDMASLQGSLAAAEASVRASAGRLSTAAAMTSRSWSQTAAAIGTHMTSIGTKMQSVGRSLTRYVTLPLVGVGAVATKFAMDYRKNLAQIEALSGDIGMSTKQLTTELERMAHETGVGMRELSEALYFIASAGLETSEVMPVLEQTARGVAVEMGDAATVGQLLTSILYDYRKSGMTAAHAMDVLTAAIKEGKAEPAEMAASLGNVLPVAAQLKVPLEDITAVIGALTNAGMDTATAVTSMRFALASLSAPTNEAKDILRKYDINVMKLRNTLAEPMGLLEVYQMLAETFDLTTRKGYDAFSAVVGGARGMRVAATLTGESAKVIEKSMGRVWNAAGEFDKAVSRMERTAAHKFRVLKADLETALIDLGKAILPILVEDVLPVIKDLIEAFDGLDKGTKRWIVQLGLLAIALGPIVRLLGFILRAGGKAITLIAGLSAATAGGTAAGGAGQLVLPGMAAGTAKKGIIAGITGIVKAHPVGAAVAVAAATTAWGLAADKADREAREYQETMTGLNYEVESYTSAVLKAKDGTVVFRGSVKDAKEELERLTGEAELLERYGTSKQWATFFDDMKWGTLEEKQAVAALVAELENLQGGFKGTTARMVQNLLKMGDLDGAYKLLKQRLNEIWGPLMKAKEATDKNRQSEEKADRQVRDWAHGIGAAAREARQAEDDTDSYSDALDKIPRSRRTRFETPGLSSAITAVGNLWQQIRNLPTRKRVEIEVAITRYYKNLPGGDGHAGGLVFHGGGLAPGEVPAVLQQGEFIINRRSAGRLGLPLLEALNRYHTGGIAGPSVTGVLPQMNVQGIVDVRLVGEALEVLRRGGDRGGAERPQVVLNHYGDNYGAEDFFAMVDTAIDHLSRAREGL